MKKALSYVFMLPLLFSFALLVVKGYPPLSADGVSVYHDEPSKMAIELRNHGFVDITVHEVFVNGKAATQAELGISTSNHLVLGANIEDDPDISFHPLGEAAITPDRERKGHYGILVHGEETPEGITMYYRYFGIPFTLEVPRRLLTN